MGELRDMVRGWREACYRLLVWLELAEPIERRIVEPLSRWLNRRGGAS